MPDAGAADTDEAGPITDGSTPADADAPDAFAEAGVLKAGDGAAESGSFTIGGDVSGLGLGGVVLQDNGNDTLTVTSNGSFTFSKALPHGATYDVTVLQAPVGRSCDVANGSGTVAFSNVTGILVYCR